MRSWSLALTAGLAASTAAGWVVDPQRRSPGRRSPSEAPVAGQSLEPIKIPTTVHVVALGTHRWLDLDAILGQLNIINDSFEPHNITFTLFDINHIVNPLWARGIDEKHMMRVNNRGDARTLNLYFVDRFRGWPDQVGSSYTPQRLADDPGAYMVDGVIVKSSKVPGAPTWHPDTWQGKTAVQIIGYWLGLLSPAVGGCQGPGDFVDDTPAMMANMSDGRCPIGLDSCPDQPGLDPVHNFMSSTADSCKTEFTAGQARRMHQVWNELRAPHRLPTGPVLAPIKPIEQPGKMPYYPKPASEEAALVLCSRDEFSKRTEETREAYCGTEAYCSLETWRAAPGGESYADFDSCIDARASPAGGQQRHEANLAAETSEKTPDPLHSHIFIGHQFLYFG